MRFVQRCPLFRDAIFSETHFLRRAFSPFNLLLQE